MRSSFVYDYTVIVKGLEQHRQAVEQNTILHPNCRCVIVDVEIEPPTGEIHHENRFATLDDEISRNLLTGASNSAILEVGSEREELNLEQAKKRDKKINVTDMAISKVSFVQPEGFSREQAIELQNHHKEILEYAKSYNESNEVLRIWDMSKDKYVSVRGTEFNVNPNGNIEAEVLMSNARLNTIAYMHNHPSTNNFSYGDIKTFGNYPTIGLMTVVTNQGEVYYLQKGKNYSAKRTSNIMKEIALGLDMQDADFSEKFVKEFIKLSKQGGVIYGTK